MASIWESNSEIQRFREYLRIKTVQPNVNYGNFSVFLIRYKANFGFEKTFILETTQFISSLSVSR